jgi:hypothetical protein
MGVGGEGAGREQAGSCCTCTLPRGGVALLRAVRRSLRSPVCGAESRRPYAALPGRVRRWLGELGGAGGRERAQRGAHESAGARRWPA